MEFKLIEAVQKCPCLFDKSEQDYRNKLKKEESWASVAAATGATGNSFYIHIIYRFNFPNIFS